MRMCTVIKVVKSKKTDIMTPNLVLNLWTTDGRRLMECQMPIQ